MTSLVERLLGLLVRAPADISDGVHGEALVLYRAIASSPNESPARASGAY